MALQARIAVPSLKSNLPISWQGYFDAAGPLPDTHDILTKKYARATQGLTVQNIQRIQDKLAELDFVRYSHQVYRFLTAIVHVLNHFPAVPSLFEQQSRQARIQYLQDALVAYRPSKGASVITKKQLRQLRSALLRDQKASLAAIPWKELRSLESSSHITVLFTQDLFCGALLERSNDIACVFCYRVNNTGKVGNGCDAADFQSAIVPCVVLRFQPYAIGTTSIVYDAIQLQPDTPRHVVIKESHFALCKASFSDSHDMELTPYQERLIAQEICGLAALGLLEGFQVAYHPREAEIRIYIAMQRVPGMNMAESFLIPSLFEGLSSSTFWSCIAACCQSLQAIHEAGILHGDIKPENIVWQPTQGKACLVDFERCRIVALETAFDRVFGRHSRVMPDNKPVKEKTVSSKVIEDIVQDRVTGHRTARSLAACIRDMLQELQHCESSAHATGQPKERLIIHDTQRCCSAEFLAPELQSPTQGKSSSEGLASTMTITRATDVWAMAQCFQILATKKTMDMLYVYTHDGYLVQRPNPYPMHPEIRHSLAWGWIEDLQRLINPILNAGTIETRLQAWDRLCKEARQKSKPQ